jgi:hypothetical protein
MMKYETTECTERNRNSLCSQEEHSLENLTGRISISSVRTIGIRNFSVIGFRRNLVFFVTLCENKFIAS